MTDKINVVSVFAETLSMIKQMKCHLELFRSSGPAEANDHSPIIFLWR